MYYFEWEVFLVLWIVIFGVLVFYLLGKIMLLYDFVFDCILVGCVLFGVVIFFFVVYFILGFWGVLLKLIFVFLLLLNYFESLFGFGVVLFVVLDLILVVEGMELGL